MVQHKEAQVALNLSHEQLETVKQAIDKTMRTRTSFVSLATLKYAEKIMSEEKG